MALKGKLSLFGLVVVTAVAVAVFGSQKPAHAAIGSSFTNATNSSTMVPMLSRQGGNIQLEASYATFRLFISPTKYNSASSFPVTFEGICSGGFTIYYKIGTDPERAGSCNGSNLVVSVPKSSFGTPGQYQTLTEAVRTASVRVRFENAGNIQTFRVNFAGQGLVSFDDEGAAKSTNPSYKPPGSDDAFSVMPDSAGVNGFNPGLGGYNSFTLSFAPDCSYANSFEGQAVYLKWFDADVGMSNQPTAISWTLTEYKKSSTGSWVVNMARDGGAWSNGRLTLSGSALGGNGPGSEVAYSVGALDWQKRYTWTWNNVNYSNGVQLKVPFSEYMYDKAFDCKAKEQPKCPYNAALLATDPKCIAPNAQPCQYDKVDHNGPGKYAPPIIVPATASGYTGAAPHVDGYAKSKWRTGLYPGNPDSVQRRVYVEIWGKNNGDEKLLVSGYVGSKHNGSGWIVDSTHTFQYADYRFIRVRYLQQERIIYHGYTQHYNKDGVLTGTTYSDDLWNWATTSDSNNTYTCYSATCQILRVTGDGAGGAVRSGGKVYVLTKITNDSGTYNQPLTHTIAGAYLSATSASADGNPNNDWYENEPGYRAPPLARGESALVMFSANAPTYSGAGVAPAGTIKAYPDYWFGMGRLGADCDSPAFDVYDQFDVNGLVATAQWRRDGLENTESPNQLHYSTQLCVVNTTSAVSLGGHDSSAWVGKEPGIDTQTLTGMSRIAHVPGGTYNPGCSNPINTNQTVDSTTVRAGDTYCAYITIPYSGGWVGPSGNVIDLYGAGQSAGPSCTTVHNKPYLHVLNSDARAGGGFGSMCTQADGGIQTYTKTTEAQPAGSGAQFGAIARGSINGFSSASLRTSTDPDPLGPIGLTFSNTGAGIPGTGNSAKFGDSFGAKHCATDFFSKSTEVGVTNGGNGASINSIEAGQTGDSARLFTPTSETLTITGASSIAAGRNYVIYVDGNVRISGNIEYGTGWTIDSVPSVHIIAKGNIYIDPGVTRLDGVYVAQQDPNDSVSKSGYIDTCSQGPALSDKNNPGIDRCRNQLVINGAFVAQHVQFQRTFGSLRNSQQGERLRALGRTCEYGTSVVSVSSGDCAAEIFNFSPEMYLARPPFDPEGGPGDLKWDYVTSLSPVL